MLRKILSTLVAFVLFGVAGQAFADAAAELEHAESYHLVWDYQPAEAGYKGVYEKYPGTNYALDAYKKLVHLYIEWGKDQQAEAALQQLLADFSDRPDDTAAAVLYIAEESVLSAKYKKAREFFQYILDNQPSQEHAVKAWAGIAVTNIALADNPNAQAAFDTLTANFSAHPDLPEALYWVAEICEGELGQYQKAQNICQQIIQQYPDSSSAAKARLNVSKCRVLLDIEAGDGPKVQAGVDSLIVDFKDHPDLSEAIFRIAEQCRNKACAKEGQGLKREAADYFRKAVTIWERLINECTDSSLVPHACSWAADSCRSLGEYAKAKDYYQKIVDYYPDYEYAWHALSMVGRSYEDLKKAEVISESEADTGAKAAYQQLLEKYPDCPAAEHARDWLSRHSSE